MHGSFVGHDKIKICQEGYYENGKTDIKENQIINWIYSSEMTANSEMIDTS